MHYVRVFYMWTKFINKWIQVFKNGPSKICGREPLKNTLTQIAFNLYNQKPRSSLENYSSNNTQHDTTRDNTRQQEYNTRQHKHKTGQHEYSTTQHECNTGTTRVQNNKIYFDLFISSLYTRSLVY